jgi:hypothetical protein
VIGRARRRASDVVHSQTQVASRQSWLLSEAGVFEPAPEALRHDVAAATEHVVSTLSQALNRGVLKPSDGAGMDRALADLDPTR